MRRGDLVTIATPGDFGKPRPALVIQSDRFPTTSTVTVLLITGTLADVPLLRIDLKPTPENNLRKPSQILVDKATSVKREKVGRVFGRIDQETMLVATRSLALFFDFA